MPQGNKDNNNNYASQEKFMWKFSYIIISIIYDATFTLHHPTIINCVHALLICHAIKLSFN